jgi:hypothetical protein
MARANPDFNPVMAYINVQFQWIETQRLQASFLVYYYYLCSGQMPLAMGNKDLLEIAHRKILGLIHEGIGRSACGKSRSP